jgi:hypothetical protein
VGWCCLEGFQARHRDLPSMYSRHAVQTAWNRSAWSSAPFKLKNDAVLPIRLQPPASRSYSSQTVSI